MIFSSTDGIRLVSTIGIQGVYGLSHTIAAIFLSKGFMFYSKFYH